MPSLSRRITITVADSQSFDLNKVEANKDVKTRQIDQSNNLGSISYLISYRSNWKTAQKLILQNNKQIDSEKIQTALYSHLTEIADIINILKEINALNKKIEDARRFQCRKLTLFTSTLHKTKSGALATDRIDLINQFHKKYKTISKLQCKINLYRFYGETTFTQITDLISNFCRTLEKDTGYYPFFKPMDKETKLAEPDNLGNVLSEELKGPAYL